MPDAVARFRRDLMPSSLLLLSSSLHSDVDCFFSEVVPMSAIAFTHKKRKQDRESKLAAAEVRYY